MSTLGFAGRIVATLAAAFAAALAAPVGRIALAQAPPQAQQAPSGRTSAPVPAPGTYDPKFFSALKWRSIGPNRGGRSQAVAGAASRPLEYYFGATGGGVWKTTDGGQSWKPMTDTVLKASSVGAIAVAESNPDVVYAGMGETELRGNIIQGDGVYKSTDAGKTWKHIGLAETQ